MDGTKKKRRTIQFHGSVFVSVKIYKSGWLLVVEDGKFIVNVSLTSRQKNDRGTK